MNTDYEKCYQALQNDVLPKIFKEPANINNVFLICPKCNSIWKPVDEGLPCPICHYLHPFFNE